MVLAVVTTPEVRIARLVGRGLTEEDARNRLKNQVPDSKREAIADMVFTNNGTIEDFETEIALWWESFKNEAAK